MDEQEKTTAQKLADFCKRNKRLLISIAVVLVLGYILVMWLENRSKTTWIAGMTVNVPLSDTGTTILTTQYKTYLGVDSDRKEAHLGQIMLQAIGGTDMNDYYGLKSLEGLCEQKQLDYLLLDQTAFEMLLSYGLYGDLTAIYTQQELEALGEMLVYCQLGENAEPVPMALEITKCPFVQAHSEASGPVYFVYTMDSPRTQAARELLAYLLAWQPAA